MHLELDVDENKLSHASIFLVLPRKPVCNVPGECSGSTLVGLTFPQNVKECLKHCKDNKECLYFTYYEDGKKYCNQFDGCEIFATNCTKCVSGEVSCPDDIQIEVDDPEIHNVYSPENDNPNVDIPDVDNPEVDNPEVGNPEVDNPEVDNLEADNPEIDNPEVYNPVPDNPEVDNLEVDNPEVDNPVLDNPYKCNLTGFCQVSYKHKSHNHNINAQIFCLKRLLDKKSIENFYRDYE